MGYRDYFKNLRKAGLIDEETYHQQLKKYKNIGNRPAPRLDPQKKILFMIKIKNMQLTQIRNIVELLKAKRYIIMQTFWVFLGEKEKFFQKFYPHVSPEIIIQQTKKNFSRNCLAIITNNQLATMDPSSLKILIRSHYGHHSVHASDDNKCANREIGLLSDLNRKDLRGVSHALRYL